MSEYKEIEKWLPVKGYEGLYEVSSFGRVKSLAKKVVCNKRDGRQFFKNMPEKIMKPTASGVNRGYFSVPLISHDRGYKRIKVHRLVALAFIPNPDNKANVNHINGIKLDNRLSNLEWCTVKENVRHAIDMGLINQSGERGCNAKYSNQDAVEILSRYRQGGITMKQLGALYGVSASSVNRLVNGQSYKNIQ